MKDARLLNSFRHLSYMGYMEGEVDSPRAKKRWEKVMNEKELRPDRGIQGFRFKALFSQDKIYSKHRFIRDIIG